MGYYIWKSYKLSRQPLDIFAALSWQEGCFFLDSSLNGPFGGRYSFLGAQPFFVFKSQGRNPFARLRSLLARYSLPAPALAPPFLGGAVGFLAYDLAFSLEDTLSKTAKPETGTPDCLFGFYNSVFIFDRLKKTLSISATGFPEQSSRLSRLLARKNFRNALGFLEKVKPRSWPPEVFAQNKACIKANFSQKTFMAAVRKTKAYIQQGDIYQLNLSQQFQAKSGLSACQIYRRLRRLSPAGFSAYLDCGDFQVLSSSPERFLQAGAGRVITRPMKGTRPRGKDICEDRRLRNELYQSPKDKAELLMITDLERNDLGRVCAYGTVKVARLRQIEQYSGVFQTTSSVQARLSRHQDRFDLLAATFPGGSVTGCPKIRAMQLIEELEPHRRGIYTGSLGYLSFCGNMDFNILIRSLLKKGKEVFFWAGSGIVADSLPEEEYEETLVKAKAMQEAINGVGLWNQG